MLFLFYPSYMSPVKQRLSPLRQKWDAVQIETRNAANGYLPTSIFNLL
jgi:hypothetical protein